MKRLELSAGRDDDGERLDRFIASRGGISRGAARRAIDTGGVFLEGQRCKVASRQVWAGQRVEVNLAEGGRDAAPAEAIDRARLLYDDADIVVVDKPSGIPSQPTLVTDRGALPELAGALVGAELSVVHRLDRETSGVTVLARSPRALRSLSDAFRDGHAHKVYLAICTAAPVPPAGRVEAPLGKDPERPGRRMVRADGDAAATRYETLRSSDRVALVRAEPETGRTHQIRVHLSHLHAPILGDARYGGPRMIAEVAIPRVMLHAQRLEIPHPDGTRMEFEAPIPADFQTLLTTMGLV